MIGFDKVENSLIGVLNKKLLQISDNMENEEGDRNKSTSLSNDSSKNTGVTKNSVSTMTDPFEQTITSYIDDIAFFRDIENDFFEEDTTFDKDRKELLKLSNTAEILLKESIRIQNNSEPFNLAIVGNFSAGKSQFINSLLQSDVCPTDIGRTTSSVSNFSYGEIEEVSQVVIDDTQEIKTRVSPEQYQQLVAFSEKKNVKTLSFEYLYPWEGLRDIVIIDTPGFNSSNDETGGGDSETTEQIIKEKADVLLWVVDINLGGIPKDQIERLKKLKNDGRENLDVFILLNKADLVPSKVNQENIKNEILKNLKEFGVDKVFLYSAKNVLKNGKTNSMAQQVSKHIESYIEKQEKQSTPNWKIDVVSSFDKIDGSTELSVCYNDAKIVKIPSIENIGLSYSEIFTKVENLKKLKPQIMKSRIHREDRYYSNKKKDILEELVKKLALRAKKQQKVAAEGYRFHQLKEKLLNRFMSPIYGNFHQEISDIMNDTDVIKQFRSKHFFSTVCEVSFKTIQTKTKKVFSNLYPVLFLEEYVKEIIEIYEIDEYKLESYLKEKLDVFNNELYQYLHERLQRQLESISSKWEVEGKNWDGVLTETFSYTYKRREAKLDGYFYSEVQLTLKVRKFLEEHIEKPLACKYPLKNEVKSSRTNYNEIIEKITNFTKGTNKNVTTI